MLEQLWTPDVQREVFSLLAALLLIVVGLVGNAARAFVKAQIARLQNRSLADILEKLVDAAEQKFGAKTGEQKAEWVIDQLQHFGVPIDDATQAKALAYLEAAVGARNGAKAIWEQNESQAVSEAATAAVDRRLADVVAQLKAGKTGDELLRGLAETWGLTGGGAQ